MLPEIVSILEIIGIVVITIGSLTVSYTHLDIRKQKLFMPKEIWVMPKTGDQEEQAYEQSCIKQDGIQPVSYTHLDVYKRQG